MKILCLFVLTLIYLNQCVECTSTFNRVDFRTVLDYMKDIYREKPQDTPSKKWFNSDKHAYGYVAYDSKQQNIVVGFRGTVTLLNMQQNLKLNLVPYPQCGALSICKVHKGFIETYHSAKQFVFEQVKTFKKRYPRSKIYITGYSLGAAQAVYCALELNLVGYDTNLLTFGSPRPGNKAFADFVNQYIQRTHYRVTFVNDAVPALPLKSLGYFHTGTEVNFIRGGGYKVELPLNSDKEYPMRPYNLFDHLRTNYEKLN